MLRFQTAELDILQNISNNARENLENENEHSTQTAVVFM